MKQGQLMGATASQEPPMPGHVEVLLAAMQVWVWLVGTVNIQQLAGLPCLYCS
jgi:hypothetical protein